eukprot:scaffold6716_cov149-Skeletonema_menzelii.AAC.4
MGTVVCGGTKNNSASGGMDGAEGDSQTSHCKSSGPEGYPYRERMDIASCRFCSGSFRGS